MEIRKNISAYKTGGEHEECIHTKVAAAVVQLNY